MDTDSDESVDTTDSALHTASTPPQRDWDFIHEIESNLIYEEEQDVTYMIPVPKNGTPKDKSLPPISIIVVKTIGLKQSRSLLKVLFDPGSTKTLISRKALPRGVIPMPLLNTKDVNALAGTMQTK